MRVNRVNIYKDGGTVELITNNGSYYIDKRLSSKTQLELYDDYPDRGNIIEESRILREELRSALTTYADNFYSEDTIDMISENLR